MSTQRERFEAAFKDKCDMRRFSMSGEYASSFTQRMWESFTKGEASGLELAAQKCDEAAYDESGYCIDPDLAELGESIRALLAREGE